jgi:serine protease Do
MHSSSKKVLLLTIFLSLFTIFISFCAGIAGSVIGSHINTLNGSTFLDGGVFQTQTVIEENAVVDVASNASPSVVSIVITKDLPVYENYLYNNYGFLSPYRRQTGTKEQEIGSGSGFVISNDGLILTNKHVVEDTDAKYTVVFSDGDQIEAEVLARDSYLDVAIIKVATDKDLKPLTLGNSDEIRVGQTAIAIGNSLGEFSNTVSKGIISGLGRTILAADASNATSESLQNVIQTDASINSGNSGGPLLDISGNVIGVNVAMANNAENIGFAIPINDIKDVIESVTKYGEIRRPYMGVRYVPVTESVQEQYDLPFAYGVLLVSVQMVKKQ